MTTSQVILALEAKGLVVREPHPRDGHAVTLSPTAAGAVLANNANLDGEAADRAFFCALLPADRAPLTRYLHDPDRSEEQAL